MVAVRNKTAQSYMRKMRNTRYLCELVKFRLAPPIRVIRLFHICLDDLEHPHNSEMVSILIENVTSFLLRGGMTRVKGEELLDKLTAARKKFVLSTEEDTRLDHSLQQLRQAMQPRRALVETGRVRSPLEQYARKLLFGMLDDDNFVKVRGQLRKMPYNNAQDGDMITSLFRKCHRIAYDKVHLLAEIVADTCDVHGWVGINVIDSIIEDLRLDLEIGKFREMQRRLQDYKYLGELYNFKVATFPLLCFVFAMLVLYFPRPDVPNDYSRVRCVCAILQTSARYFLRKATTGERQCLRKLLAYFYLHVHSRTKPFPMDLDHRINDAFTTLKQLLSKKRHGREKIEFPQTRAEAEGCLARVQAEAVGKEEEWFELMITALRSQENMRIYPVLRTVMPVGFDAAKDFSESSASASAQPQSAKREGDDEDVDSDSDSDESDSSSSSSGGDEEEMSSNIVTPTMGPLANAFSASRRSHQQTEEDREFDALFRDAMKEASAENVKRTQHKSAQNMERNVEVKMSVSLTPLVKGSRDTAAAKTMLYRIAAERKASEEPSSPQTPATPSTPAAEVERGFVKISILRRNQEKIEAQGIYIPSDSEFAQRSSAIVQRHQIEMEEQKLQTLQLQRQHEAEAEAERRAAGWGVGARRGRGGMRHS
jgi:regulator of nonsense transcripts 2